MENCLLHKDLKTKPQSAMYDVVHPSFKIAMLKHAPKHLKTWHQCGTILGTSIGVIIVLVINTGEKNHRVRNTG